MKINRNRKFLFVFLLFILPLTILSCTDETTIIQNGGGGMTLFEVKRYLPLCLPRA